MLHWHLQLMPAAGFLQRLELHILLGHRRVQARGLLPYLRERLPDDLEALVSAVRGAG